MAAAIRKAERQKAKLRLALAGPSGSGKTMSALKLARGVVGPEGRICMIDTERGSGDLYAGLTDYDIITLAPPFKPSAYVEALHDAEAAGYDIIIVDSLSHAWMDEGGLLDQADKMEASGKNRFTMWAELTPQHRALVNALLQSPKHLVVTMRSKQEYALEKDEKTGKNRVRKLGMGVVQRDGIEYEFTVLLDIEQNHHAHASKDRTAMFDDEIFLIDEKTGQRLATWLNEGKDAPPEKAKSAAEELSPAKKRILIGDLMDELGSPIRGADAELARSAIIAKTGLAPSEENLAEIITRLETIKLTGRHEGAGEEIHY